MESSGTDRDSDITELVEYVKKITFLYSLDHRDWNAKVINMIRIWLINSTELVLTIFYDGNVLTGCLGFPVAPVIDLCYFIRSSNEILSTFSFHDVINFGTMQDDVDGCLLKILELIYAPIFRNFTDWGDNVKQRFCTSLDKFLGVLTAIYFKMSGMTVLYVPYVVKQIARETSSYDREFVKNLECIAVSWATLIRILLNDKTLTSSNEYISVGDEFEFWLYRFEVLQGLNAQLDQLDVQHIIRVLRITHSVYIKQIDELIYESKHELVEAMSNIKFLHLLMQPCSKIDLAESPTLVSHLIPRIIHLIRFIWLNSEQYNRRDLITGIFRDLSNQIIRFCTEMVNIEKILSGCSRFGIKICNMCIDCCLTYKGIYDMMSKIHSEINLQVGWNLDNAMIFNHVDAFMERLNDVIDICESMMVFGRLDESESIPKPQFGGTSGTEFETTADNVENEFMVTLTGLCTDSKEIILNVHKNEWYEEVIRYRRTVQSMEETVQRLMSNVFQHICNVEEALESLNVMIFYSYRSTIRKTFLRQVSSAWVLFANEIDSTVHMLMDRSKMHESWVPYYASRALGYRVNLERLVWLSNRLNSSEWLPNVSEASVVLKKFESVRREFDKEIKKSFDEWQKNCCSLLLNQKLDRSLLIRSKKKKGLIECNIDRTILTICEQAQHFERLGLGVPGMVRKIYEKHETLRFVYNSVVQVCLNYNHILSALSDQERKLFRALIQACDRKIAPGVFKLTYGGELSDAYIADCAKHTNKLQETMDIYKRANQNIARLCEKICDTPMLKFNFSGAVTIALFEQHLTNYLRRVSNILRGFYSTITDLLFAVFKEFQAVIEDMPIEWYGFVNVFDDMLATAFLTSAKNSLNMLTYALHRDADMAAAPILVMESDVKNRCIVLTPDIDVIASLISGYKDRIHNILEQFPRIGIKMKLPKEHQYDSFSKAFHEDSESAQLICNIEAEINHEKEEIDGYISFWNSHRMLWETTESEFTKRVKATQMTADIFEASIEYYSAMADDISYVDAITHVYFILMNQNYIKSSILDCIEKWQALNIKILLSHSFSLIRAIYRYMRKNERKILMVPRTLKESLLAKQFFERIINEVSLKQAGFPPTLELFALLDKYQVEIPEEIRIKVMGLETAWQHYLKRLGEADEMLDNNREEFKKILVQQAEKFKIILKEFLDDFFF